MPNTAFDAATMLDADITSLPLNYEGNYPATLRRFLDGYQSQILQLSATDFVTNEINLASHRIAGACNHVLGAVDRLAKGDESTARTHFEATLSFVKPGIDRLRSNAVPGTKVPRLYRLRDPKGPDIVDLGGIFHIPAEHRAKASAARYSLDKEPSLYLSRAMYIAYLEIGPCVKARTWVSAFQLAESEAFRVLDFGWTPELIADMVRKNPGALLGDGYGQFAVAYAIALPLIAACSCRRDPTGTGPHPEYRIPQWLLAWLAQQPELIGMRYFSTRKVEAEGPLFLQNYVFPAVDLGTTGYSPRLRSAFQLTRPALIPEAAALGRGAPRTGRNLTRFTDESGTILHYGTTDFADAESWLEQQPLLAL